MGNMVKMKLTPWATQTDKTEKFILAADDKELSELAVMRGKLREKPPKGIVVKE